MKRILVIGTSGSGKSTLAKKIAKHLDLPYVATDAFYWKEDWKQASTKSVIEEVQEVIRKDTWVMDGNFEDQRQMVWSKADMIIWIDLPKHITLFRVLKRNLAWWLRKQSTWSANKMTWSRTWSGFFHARRSYNLKRQRYPSYFAEFPDVQVHRLKTSKEVKDWLTNLSLNVNRGASTTA